MHLLEGQGLSKAFGGLVAVNNVSFYVDEAEILGLIGPNGAGKTTLFNLISAAIKPTAGKIFFGGRDITSLAPHEICHLGIARTFQTVKIFPNMTVFQNVSIGALFGTKERVDSKMAAQRAEQALEFVGLLDLRSALAGDLTLGCQKRIEIARALATQPRLLLLDEVMAGLTHTEVDEAMSLVKCIRESGITVIMIEHVMHAIMNICDRIMVLDHGVKICEGTPSEVSQDAKVIECYLGEEVAELPEGAGGSRA